MIDKIIKDLQSYIHELLGLAVEVTKWQTDQQLPVVLEQICTFYETELLGAKHLLMMVSGSKESSPVYARKLIDLISDYWDEEVIYVLPRVTSYNRKRLIDRKISFIVPGSQLYLPLCGLDLREHFQKLRKPKKNFSPSTQVICLAILYGRFSGRITPSSLAEKLSYTAMTMSRGLDELTLEGIFKEHTEWRERVAYFEGNRKELWDRVRERMTSPVKKKHHILLPEAGVDCQLYSAGESALHRYNMLSKPENPVYAVSTECWKKLSNIDGVIEIESREPDSIIIEVWKYAPELFARKNMVDPISLYLSINSAKDKRVKAAREKLVNFVGEGLRNVQGS